MKMVFAGLSITSSWGNGHATTYRALLRALAARGHEILFLEREAEWYAGNRDMPSPPFCATRLYRSVDELAARFAPAIREADVVVVGSYVPEGAVIGDLVLRLATGVTAFYDIDTPVTLARLASGLEYITPRQIREYDLYLSFTGGPTLDALQELGARCPRPLYCSVDPEIYRPVPPGRDPLPLDLSYLGTYSADRQPRLDRLMLEPARRWPAGRFAVAGPQYPASIEWPANVRRITHLEPARHRWFYTASRFSLNITRDDMAAVGYAPSVRLFEAAACGAAIISDSWAGLEEFLRPGAEILVSGSAAQTLACLHDLGEAERQALGERARRRVLARHTAAHRALDFEAAVADAGRSPSIVAGTATAREAAS